MKKKLLIGYHAVMMHFYALRVHLLIVRLKRRGKRAGLPSLDGYSDEEIVLGMMLATNAEHGDLWPDGTYRYDGAEWQPTGTGQ